MLNAITSFADLEKYLRDYLDQPFNFEGSYDFYPLLGTVYLGPKRPFLDRFNRIVIEQIRHCSGISYTFTSTQFYTADDVLDSANFLLAINWSNQTGRMKIAFPLSDMGREDGTWSLAEDDVWNIVKQAFSASYVENELTSQEEWFKRIRNTFDQWNERGVAEDDDGVLQPPVVRIEEMRGDLRTVLMVTPAPDDLYNLKLSLATPASAGIPNPVTGLFMAKFEDGFTVEAFNREHNLDFYEMQGYPNWPQNLNNQQRFDFGFNCINGRIPGRVALSRGARNQIKLANEILEILCLQGISTASNASPFLSPATGLPADMAASMRRPVKFLNWRGFFQHPLYDIAMIGHLKNFEHMIMCEEHGPPVVVFLEIGVFPFIKDPVEQNSIRIHPILYAAGK